MHRSAEGIVSGGKDGTIKLWSSNLTLITSIDLSVTSLTPDQLCLRSVFWHEDHIVVGTKTSCIIDVDVKDRGRPRLVVGGHSEGAMWALATHPKQDVFVTGEKFLHLILVLNFCWFDNCCEAKINVKHEIEINQLILNSMRKNERIFE